MRFIELDFEGSHALSGEVPEIRAVAVPDERTLVLCSAHPPYLWSATPAGTRPMDLDAPGFVPRLLVDADEGRVLAIGDGENSGVLLQPDGRVLRRFNLGEGIRDAALDPDGNIVVLRRAAPLLDRYGPEGDLEEDDPQLTHVHEQTVEEEGRMLLIARDGSLWLNLREVYNVDGEVLLRWRDVPSGRVSADLFGWSGTLVLDEDGALVVRTSEGESRHVAAGPVEAALGRGATALRDVIITRDDRLWLVDTAGRRILSFRVMSE
jgi:hypothetical protein